ncbi:MAG: helix-turn-helix domain-containing protein [Paludibacteraceae bacterium]|nr:helix-turn-helix domain-containing protein [Paludibacteraceae bacterium]
MKRVECNICAKIAERIELILQKRGMTHRDFANLLGKRESEISRWMSGKHNFTIATIADIEFALKESIIEYTTQTDVLLAAEQACAYNTPDSLRTTCIGLLNRTDDINVLFSIQKNIENLINSVGMNNSKSDDFIKSLQLRGGRSVPNNVNGIECLIEEKYIRR